MEEVVTAEELLPPGSEITLENCHREPIHTPGGIQPHGALLVVATSDRRIVQRSENALERLGREAEVLQRPLGELCEPQDVEWLIAPADGVDAAGLRPRTVQIGARRFDAVSYRSGPDLVVVELEPAADTVSAAVLADDIASLLVALQAAQAPLELLESAAHWARELTGFDRVWIYRFEPDDHGVVIAEEKADDRDPFLGLHFPARDIPPQARALFLQNRVRFIPDSFGAASPLVPLTRQADGEWLDLSPGILRAVSPMHLQYLQNMGATASLSIALEVDGGLWGLISGHHYAGPRVVPHRVRLACEVLGRVVSTQLSSLLTQNAARRRAVTDGHREAILAAIASGDARGEAGGLTDASTLQRSGAALLELCGADGVAVIGVDRTAILGATPREAVIRQILAAADQTDLLVTDSLATDLPELANAARPACGVIVLPLSRTGATTVIWFRNEYAHSLTWGDNGLAPAKGRLSPAGSYATWTESVQGEGRPWSPLDREAVLSLRAGIGTVVLDQAEELDRANRELARSNSDLEAFTYVIAHDLREPLRNMQSFLDFYLEDHGGAIEHDGAEQLATVGRLGRQMDAMMDSLLDHARADRLRPELATVTLTDLLDDTLPMLDPHSRHAEVRVLTPEARVLVDRDAMRHVLLNLITNALKYSTDEHPVIEIDVRPIEQTLRGGTPGLAVVAVRDQGIGVAPEHHETIFELFRRLHPRDAFGGGSGAGLAIARRLTERQGGEIWLDHSAPGEGSLFCVAVALPSVDTG